MFVHMITKVSSFLQQKTTASFVVLPLFLFISENKHK